MTYKLVGAYNRKYRKLTVSNTKKLLFALNKIGAKIDLEKSKTLVVLDIVFEDGTTVKCGNKYQCRPMLQEIEDRFNLGINVQKSSIVGSLYSVFFFEDVYDKLYGESKPQVTRDITQEKEKDISESQEDETNQEELQSDSEVETNDTTEQEPEVLEVNITAMKSPTFGKKNLLSVADKLNINLDGSLKYKDLYESFVEEYNKLEQQ